MVIGSNKIFIPDLTSTNTFSSAFVKTGPPPEGLIIYTNYQTAGRGQKGSGWESEDGKNLLFSAILYPKMISPSDQFILSKFVSLAVYDFLTEYTPDIHIKWPNDIYAGSDKIAGILIENSIMDGKIESTVVGIGLNVNQTVFKSGAPNPVSLSLLTGKTYELPECMDKLSVFLDKRYDQLLNKKQSVLDFDYQSKLYRKDQWCMYKDNDKTFEGKIISVAGSGLLQIEDRDGSVHEYSFKEVSFMP